MKSQSKTLISSSSMCLKSACVFTEDCTLAFRPDFFLLVDLRGKIIRFRDGGRKKKALKMTS